MLGAPPNLNRLSERPGQVKTPTSESTILRLRHVRANRPSGASTVEVIHDLDLDVARGELVALMGPSGSGKTSVLRLASGLLAPAAGTITLDGTEMKPQARRAWAAARRRTIGMVHQRLDLLEGLNVLDNVALPLLLDGIGAAQSHASARAALERLGAQDLETAIPEQLSIGQQQLVAVARAIVGDRRLILADEPTAALDTVTAERVVEVLSELAASGLGVLMATHDSRLAGWADRVERLTDGTLEQKEAMQ